MSLWQVNDKITSDLMESMYEEFINNGKTINQSLQKAKLDYLEDADSYLAHPFYWASFVHLGENINYRKEINGPHVRMTFIGFNAPLHNIIICV